MGLINWRTLRDGWTDRNLIALKIAFDNLDGEVLRNAVLLSPVQINTTDTAVYHGLGRAPKGYVLVKSPSDIRIFDGATPSTQPNQWITLRASSAAVLTVLVF